jgi:hypothetical protein
MRDRHFMEDENELPYLVYSRRDDDRTSVGGHAFIKKDFENVPFEEFAIYMNRLILSQEHKIRIINSIEVKPKNVFVSIHHKGNEVRLEFDVRTHYFEIRVYLTYDADVSKFVGYYDSYSHVNLVSSDWFKREVAKKEREIGKKYLACAGGYVVKCDEYSCIITDKLNVDAHFDDGNNGTIGYAVDLEGKTITDDYFEFPYYLYL